MEIKYIKSAARVLNRSCINKEGLVFSKNILCVSVGQEAADLQAVKVGGQKNSDILSLRLRLPTLIFPPSKFFQLLTLTANEFAAS